MAKDTSERLLPFYRVGAFACRWFLRILYGTKVDGLDMIPTSGAGIVACNHQSLLDPPLVGSAVRHRQLWFMAKKELFQTPLLGAFLSRCGCFWVDRKARNAEAVDRAVELLQQGKVVAMFPEGTRSKDGKLKAGRSGAAVLALRTGAPVIPGAVYNTHSSNRSIWLGGKSIGLRFGKPLQFDREEDPTPARIREVRDQIMAAIGKILEQSQAAEQGPGQKPLS